jgi:choline dehydrogenase
MSDRDTMQPPDPTQPRAAETVAPFTNELPVKIRFGEGAAGDLGAILGQLQTPTATVVIDAGLEESNGAVAAALQALERDGVSLRRHRKPAGAPTSTTVDDAAAALAGRGAPVIIAIGGGSVIDTAKAARLCVQLGCGFAQALESGPVVPPPDTTLIAVPTTAGTGSEVSGGAVITDVATGRKAGIASPNLRAEYAIVDPCLTYSVPPALTAYTGIDALAQAIAGMIARTRTPIGDAIALEAVRLIGRSLVPAWRDGGDAAARAEMACGSLMAGLTMNISDCTAEHSLGQAIASVRHAPHGLTVGVVLAHTLEREREHVAGQLDRIADVLQLPADGSAPGARTIRWVQGLLGELEFPVLSSLGIDEGDLDQLTDLATQDFFLTQSVVPWSPDEVRAVLRAAIAEPSRT